MMSNSVAEEYSIQTIEIHASNLKYENKFREAIQCYSKAIEYANSLRRTNQRSLYVDRGKCYQELGNHPDAIQDFKMALSLDRYDSAGKCRSLLSKSLVQSGNYIDAVEVLVPTRDSNLLSKLGNELCSLGRFEEALRAYTEAIIQKSRPEYYRSRGICFTKMGDLDAALEDFKKTVEKDVNFPDLDKNGYHRALLCLAWLNDGKFKEAQKEMQNLHASQLIRMGDELLYGNKLEAAHVCYSQAITMYPNDMECYKKRGLYYKKVNETAKAIHDFEKATEIDPFCLACWIELGELQMQDGRHDEAEKTFTDIRKNIADAKHNIRIDMAFDKIEKMKEMARLKKLKVRQSSERQV